MAGSTPKLSSSEDRGRVQFQYYIQGDAFDHRSGRKRGQGDLAGALSPWAFLRASWGMLGRRRGPTAAESRRMGVRLMPEHGVIVRRPCRRRLLLGLQAEAAARAAMTCPRLRGQAALRRFRVGRRRTSAGVAEGLPTSSHRTLAHSGWAESVGSAMI